MAVITASTDLTFSFPMANVRIENKRRVVTGTITFSATTSNTYPSSGGIALPTTPGDWGMVRNIDRIIIFDNNIQGGSGPAWYYQATAHALRAFENVVTLATTFPADATTTTPFRELPTTWTATIPSAAPVLHVKAEGW